MLNLPRYLCFFLDDFALVELLFKRIWDFVSGFQLFLLPQPQFLYVLAQYLGACVGFDHNFVELDEQERFSDAVAQDLSWGFGNEVVEIVVVFMLSCQYKHIFLGMEKLFFLFLVGFMGHFFVAKSFTGMDQKLLISHRDVVKLDHFQNFHIVLERFYDVGPVLASLI